LVNRLWGGEAKFGSDNLTGVGHGKFDTKRIKQSLPDEREQSLGGQSDELEKEAVK
jgi:hypothetical protein